MALSLSTKVLDCQVPEHSTGCLPSGLVALRRPAAFCMAEKKLRMREIVARNLRALMDSEGVSEHWVADKSGVSQKAINKILKCESSPGIETIDKVAKAFGLHGWQLQLQTFAADVMNSPDMQKLLENYVAASPESRQYINRIAEKESQYKHGK